jgi:hypothetical protein
MFGGGAFLSLIDKASAEVKASVGALANGVETFGKTAEEGLESAKQHTANTADWVEKQSVKAAQRVEQEGVRAVELAGRTVRAVGPALEDLKDKFLGAFKGVCIPCVIERILQPFGASVPVPSFDTQQKRLAEGAAVWPGQQHYGNCGVQSSAQIIWQVKGKQPDEKALLEEAIQNGDADQGITDETTGGTNAQQRQSILKVYGVDSTIESTSVGALANALKEGKGVIATVNAGTLWDDSQYYDNGAQNHAVMVYAGDYDKDGHLTAVYLNDTGDGEQGRKLSIDDFMAAANGGVLNITTGRIW